MQEIALVKTPYQLLELYSFYIWRSGRYRGRSGGALFRIGLLLGTRVRIEFLNAPRKRPVHRLLCSCEHVSDKSAVVCEATSFRLVEVHRRFERHPTAGTLHKQWFPSA
jgi:hypothetical protein